jgi:hypothetical protein
MKKILYQLRCFYPLGKLALFVKVLGLKISGGIVESQENKAKPLWAKLLKMRMTSERNKSK